MKRNSSRRVTGSNPVLRMPLGRGENLERDINER